VAGHTPRSAVVAVVLAVLVTAGALAGAEVIRWRATPAGPAATSQRPPPSSIVGVSGCLINPCTVPAATKIGGTSVELVADAGGHSGRLRIGGVAAGGTVIEATITDIGVTLTQDSLQCVAGGPAACLIRGEHEGGLAGQVVVGRSDTWSLTEKTYVSTAGYLVLANIDTDAAPEILAAQRSECASSTCPVFLQVFGVDGKDAGCTKEYPRLDKLPGNGSVKITESMLGPCP
jgi:hypothetical protein